MQEQKNNESQKMQEEDTLENQSSQIEKLKKQIATYEEMQTFKNEEVFRYYLVQGIYGMNRQQEKTNEILSKIGQVLVNFGKSFGGHNYVPQAPPVLPEEDEDIDEELDDDPMLKQIDKQKEDLIKLREEITARRDEPRVKLRGRHTKKTDDLEDD